MSTLAESILNAASQLAEGEPLVAKLFLHLGSRAAVDQALARLARSGQVLRISRGVYVLPVRTKFGVRPPSVPKVVEALAHAKGEQVAPHGAASANALGVTPQVPMRTVYLTSGPSRRLKLGAQEVELRHAAPWLLTLPENAAGQVIRALAWLGPEQSRVTLPELTRKLQPSDRQALLAARVKVPSWMAEQLGAFVNA